MIANKRFSSLSAHTFLAAAAATLASCSTGEVDSEQVQTATIWAGVELTAKGDGRTGVKVELNENSSTGNNVRLSANERLEASASGRTVVLVEDNDIADIDYEGILTTAATNAQFRISLFRADGSIVNGSTAMLPEPFQIAAPRTNQAFRIGDIISIRWSPASAGNELSVTVSTSCTTSGGGGSASAQFRTVADSGTFDFDTQELSIADDPAVSSCSMNMTLRRQLSGTLDPAFRGGGYVRATQERRVEDMSISR